MAAVPFLQAVSTKYAEVENLVCVVAGDCGVTEVGNTAGFRMHLPNVRKIDFSGATSFKGWGVPSGLAEAMDKVTHFVLDDVPLPGGDDAPIKHSLMNVTSLSLNRTRITWDALAEISNAGGGLACLEQLSLAGNGIAALDAPAKLKRLTKLTLDDNALTSWDAIVKLAQASPKLTLLSVAGNPLPAVTKDIADALGKAAPGLKTLKLGDGIAIEPAAKEALAAVAVEGGAAVASGSKTFLEAVKGKYVDCNDDVAADEDLVVAGDGQREVKKWQMVGMAKHKAKTGQLAKLRSAAVGEEGITAVGDAATIAAALPNLQQLELSLAQSFAGWEVPAGITQALPNLLHLDLSCVALHNAPAPPAAAFARLQKLVLNKTGVAWSDVAAMTQDGEGLPLLKELHVDSNRIVSVATPAAKLPKLEYLSLMDNGIAAWGDVLGVLESAPGLRELVLTRNGLPEPDADVVRAITMSDVSALSVTDNPVGSIGFTKLLAGNQQLTSLKFTYPTVEGVAPNHVRLMVIACMPHLRNLNTSSVSTKERGEAEKLYILRAYATLPSGTKHADDCSDLKEDFLLAYPRYQELVAKWSNPSTTGSATTTTASSNGTVALTIRDCIEGKKMKADATRALPVFVKVGQLKAVVKSVFDVPPAEQVLLYKSLDAEIPIPTPLDNDLETLAYFGITGGSGLLEVSLKK